MIRFALTNDRGCIEVFAIRLQLRFVAGEIDTPNLEPEGYGEEDRTGKSNWNHDRRTAARRRTSSDCRSVTQATMQLGCGLAPGGSWHASLPQRGGAEHGT